MNEKDRFLELWEREFQTTIKVIKAYPHDKLDLQPSEKSRNARNLIWTFVGEEMMITQAVNGAIEFAPGPPAPESLDELVNIYQHSHREVHSKIEGLSEEQCNATVQFPVGPGKMGDFRCIDIMWLSLYDMIHHRGQLSVYLRIAGGKLPSIYGPTADEPWS